MYYRNLKVLWFQDCLFVWLCPLLRTVLRPSTQCIQFPTPRAWPVYDFKVLVRQLFRPLSLPVVPVLFCQEYLQIAVVGVYRDRLVLSFPHQVAIPLLECLHNRKQLLIVDLIISFGWV